MEFSIIIPIYNVAPYLRECLDSVLAQTYTDWEAICVDDGSTDRCGEILDEYAAKDGRFRVIHQDNAGVSAARNAALEVAQGDYLVYVDADDLISNDYLARFAGLIEVRNAPDVIRLRGYHRLANDGRVDRAMLRNMEGCGAVEKMCSLIIGNASLCFNIYRHSAFAALRFPDAVRYGEDDVYMMRMLSLVKSVEQSDIDGYFYRYLREGAASRILTCHDMSILFDNLCMMVTELVRGGFDRLIMDKFYKAFVRKDVFRVLNKESRAGSDEMRRSLLKIKKELGSFLREFPISVRVGLGGFLITGSWLIYDTICFIRNLIIGAHLYWK